MSSEQEAERRKQEAGKHPAGDHASPADSDQGSASDEENCAVCGVPALVWRKCKLICENCGSVNKSCADL